MAECDCVTVQEQVVVPDPVVAKEVVALPGEKGDKGDPFTYDDFTPEQIAELQRPATDAAAVAIASAQRAEKAADNVQSAVEDAEQASQSAQKAATAAQEAVKNANTAIGKTETAINNANTATEQANAAVESVNALEERVEQAEATRVQSERGRQENEVSRNFSEQQREANETERKQKFSQIESDATALKNSLNEAEAQRVSAENAREEAETQRETAEQERTTQFSEIKTEVETLISQTTEAKNAANTAATSANNAASAANTAAESATEAAAVANQAAEKANKAAESIAYNENGFYISHALLEATGLRYIGFKEIKDDKNCYLLTVGRCLKFSLDTYEVFWDVKLEGYGSQWHEAAEQLRVIEDKVYITCAKWGDIDTGIWLIKLNEEDGAFISEEFIPIPVKYSHGTFKNKEVLITKNYIYGANSVNKQILRCSMEDKSVEIVDSIDSTISHYFVFGNRWITLPDGSVKYSLVWVSSKNNIKIVDEDNNLYSISLTFSNSAQIVGSENNTIYNIDLKTGHLNFLINTDRYVITLTNKGNNVFSAENINVRNSYQNFPFGLEFYSNSMKEPNYLKSTNIFYVDNLGFYNPITYKSYVFLPNYVGVILACNLSTSNIQVRNTIDILNVV